MDGKRKAAMKVQDLINTIREDDSDLDDLCESSGDEFVLKASEEESSDDEPLSKLRLKMNDTNIPQQNVESSARASTSTCSSDASDDNIPLLFLYDRGKSTSLENSNTTSTVVAEVSLDDIDDPALSEFLQNTNEIEFDWAREQFLPPLDTKFKGKLEVSHPDNEVGSPLKYFKMLVTDAMINHMTEQTNYYAMQKEGVQLNTTAKEIEIMLGVYLRMGLVKMPRVRAYWEAQSRFGPIANKIPRNRFEKLTSVLHFRDNLTATEHDKRDKLWKLRPWLDSLRQNFLAIPSEENHSVDEIMVAFKGKSSIKQYIRGKPNPWGFKLWGRAGASGILYDFDVYQGASKEKRSPGSLGVGGDVVMKLVSSLEEGQNYKLFADNYFTSLPLVNALARKGIWYAGTVRSNRLRGCEFKSEKDLKREGRGSVDVQVDRVSNIMALRWYDNKAVDVVSNYVGAEPMGEVRRWDKSTRQYINIPRPKIIETYNSYMGGVDLLDSLTSLYKQKMKSRRWYMYIFWHTLLIAVVNAWLWYKRHCNLVRAKPMKLCAFIADVATGLVECRVKVGRPTYLPSPMLKPNNERKRPLDDSRQDHVDHLPIWETKRQRCKFSGCDGFSHVKCMKCGVHLCINKDRNCFTGFHI